MEKAKYLGLIIILTMVLAACGSGAANGWTTVLNEDYPDALPILSQLTLGTLKLEATELAVNADQAAELLTLWQAIRSLSASDITAEGEIEAIINQILETMTQEQLEAIAAMELIQEDVFALMEELGITRGGNWASDSDQPFSPPEGFSSDGDQPFRPPEGFSPGGGPGGGMGGGPGGMGIGELSGELNPEQIATLQAERAEKRNSGDRSSMFLLQPLIQILEERTQS